MASRTASIVASPIGWGSVIGGVFVALVIHILLNMLGAGIGAATVSFNAPTSGEVQALRWTAFGWWSISGVLAAFLGGWAAGAFSGAGDKLEAGTNAFLSWAVTTVLIIAIGALAAGTAAATTGVLLAPLTTALTGLQMSTDIAQTGFATFMLVSFIALIIGALAAIWGGRLAAGRPASGSSQRRSQKT